MSDEDFRNSELEKWLRSKNMTTKKFSDLVGCSRIIIWKVKKGMPICPRYGDRIKELTEGAVCPKTEPVGRPR